MLLHITCEAGRNIEPKKFIVHTPDTDVLIICLAHLNRMNGEIYIRTGAGYRLRTMSLKKIKESLKQHIGETESINVLCDALIVYHSFT
jgi:hypothetical protein